MIRIFPKRLRVPFIFSARAKTTLKHHRCLRHLGKWAAIATLTALAVPVSACDESCRKAKAEARDGENIPGYLSWSYCEDIKTEFMTMGMRSLQRYRDTNLDTNRKRGMKNTQRYIDQRKEWLLECDSYLVKTERGRLFKDKKTTDQIFQAMDSVAGELTSLTKGVTYSSDFGQSSTTVAAEKFDQLFELVDTHKTLLQLKGQFVLRDR